MHWGQFVDHDLDLALASTSKVSYVTGIVLCAIVVSSYLCVQYYEQPEGYNKLLMRYYEHLVRYFEQQLL